jgi:sphingolipid delta-4 desaturase
MPNPRADFSHSPHAEPHKGRTKAILAKHPEIRDHIGKNPYSAIPTLIIVGGQIGIAAWVAQGPWWVLFLVAYTVGAMSNHALFVMIHEAAHNLIFRHRVANTLLAITANIPSLIPNAVSFQKYHLMHHSHQGDYDLDADIPSQWEARLVGNSALGKALWLLLFPFAQITRVFRMRRIPPVDRWIVFNFAVIVTTDVLLYIVLGGPAVLYLLASTFFSIGLHPLGARWIQRHYMVDATQETYSYYGPANKLAFNVGYHNEHHDFPSVPWNRLPQVRKIAAPWYDTLVSHRSWTRLLIRFLFDRKMSLFSRMVREGRADKAAVDQAG